MIPPHKSAVMARALLESPAHLSPLPPAESARRTRNGGQLTAWSAASSASPSGTNPSNTFLQGLRPAATLAQWFSLLPVAKPSADEEAAFRWRSPRTAYALLVILGSFVESMFSLLRMVETGVNFFTSVNVIFYTTSMTTSIVFLRLSVRWRDAFSFYSRLERFVTSQNGYPTHLANKMVIITGVLLLMALLEHALSIASTISYVWPCYERGGLSLLIEGYYITKYRKTFTTLRYDFFRAGILFMLQVITTFIWNFSDLFIILVSMGLAAHFRQLNSELESAKSKTRHEDYWRQKRETYNALAMLTRTTSDFIGPVVLISYSANLYFICLQLLIITKRPDYPTVLHDIYFFFSLIYLIVRTCIMSLVAADVCLESQRPKPVLFSVPPTSFCTEVQRFLMQVNTDSIALTGCNFFSVTRSFMLTVAGTIVTYMVILVQFEQTETAEQSSHSNRTMACTCEDLVMVNCP